MNNDTKMIKITSKGFVTTSRGRVMTPIVRPYREKVSVIFDMLSQGQKPTIIEVLPNKLEVKVTTSNFDKDNSLAKPVINPASITPSVNKADESAKKESETPGVQPQSSNQSRSTDIDDNQTDHATNDVESQESMKNPDTPNNAGVQPQSSNQSRKHKKNKYGKNNSNRENDNNSQQITITGDETPVGEQL